MLQTQDCFNHSRKTQREEGSVLRRHTRWPPRLQCSVRLLLLLSSLCCLALITHLPFSASQSTASSFITSLTQPAVPSVVVLSVTPLVNGAAHSSANPLPASRCESHLVPIPISLAQLLRPDLYFGSGTGSGGTDDGSPTVAIMFGGLDGNQNILNDAWLLNVSSTFTDVSAGWYSLRANGLNSSAPSTPAPSNPAPPSPAGASDIYSLPPRHGFAMAFLPATGRLIAYGGLDSAGNFLNDVFEYDFFASAANGGMGWKKTSINQSALAPAGRAFDGGWAVNISAALGGAAATDSASMYAGVTFSQLTSTGQASLNDLWSLQFAINPSNPSGPLLAQWVQPETNSTCITSNQVCPDSKAFATVFPELNVNFTNALLNLDNIADNTALRPSNVTNTLSQIQFLSSSLASALNQPAYTQWSSSHSTVDGACSEVCLEQAKDGNRPSAREGHGISLWQGTWGGVSVNKLVLWGGYSCADLGDPTNSNCFDHDLYLFDLNTLTWERRRIPPQPPATPLQAWPLRRAFHTQHIYTSATTAQLWIFGGTFTDLSWTITFKNDIAVYDLLNQRWYLSNFDLPPAFTDASRLDVFNYLATQHTGTSRATSFLNGNQMIVYGGCTIGSQAGPFAPPVLSPTSDADQIWVFKLNQKPLATNFRVQNDDPSVVVGQGASRAQWNKNNYFLIEAAVNELFTPTWPPGSPLDILNQNLAPLLPSSPSPLSPLPLWGPPLTWATGLAPRIQVSMVGHAAVDQVVASSNLTTTIFYSPQINEMGSGIYQVNYNINQGQSWTFSVTVDGLDVPGSPFIVKLASGPASGLLSRPADASKPIPFYSYSSANFTNQRYGNFLGVYPPLAGVGYGLQQSVQDYTASFLLQIVDVNFQDWVDNSNSIAYANQFLNSSSLVDAINITMQLRDTTTAAFISQFSLSTDYNYINNNDGTYLVTYQVPPLSAYALQVFVNGAPIANGQLFPVTVLQKLTLDPSEEGAMLGINSILTLLIVLCFLLFLAARNNPIISSRSLLFDFMFVIGSLLSVITILEQTDFTNSNYVTPDHYVHVGSHNACVAYPFLLGLTFIFTMGSLYGMVRRAHLIAKRIRHSARPDADKKGAKIILNQDKPKSQQIIDGVIQLPLIPNVPTDWRIAAPVFLCVLVEVVFQCVWIGAAPLVPTIHAAGDGMRTYIVCNGNQQSSWLYACIGIHVAFGAFFIYAIRSGRKIPDALGEAKLLAWVGYNQIFTASVATILVIFLSTLDSIKTSFVVSTFAIFWSNFLFVCLIYIPRARRIFLAMKQGGSESSSGGDAHSGRTIDASWYDNWILLVQEAELAALARQEKEDREAKSSLPNVNTFGAGSQLSANPATASSLGNPSALGANISSIGGPSTSNSSNTSTVSTSSTYLAPPRPAHRGPTARPAATAVTSPKSPAARLNTALASSKAPAAAPASGMGPQNLDSLPEENSKL